MLVYEIKVSKEKRNEILREYLTCELSCRELGEKHHVKGDTIRKWTYRYLNEGNVVSLQPDSNPFEDMARKKKESKKSPEVALLEARIRELELQNLALNTLIDVAERNGIEIRKKSGAKQ